MSFWNELSTPIKGAVVVGLVLILGFGGYLAFSGEEDQPQQQRGLQPAAP